MSYVIRHHLTHEALQDLLILLNTLLPAAIPATKYFKAFDSGVFQVKLLLFIFYIYGENVSNWYINHKSLLSILIIEI